jgi:hypothetical protein
METVLAFTKCEKLLIFFFALTLPLANPWVRGDGVGYYAFGRALLVDHRLDFTKDWARANESFRLGRTDASGQVLREEYTRTGHLNNHFSIGPAILWSPFLLVADFGVTAFDKFGGHIPRDGFSMPYLRAMALGTAVYGFLSLFISFRLAREYVREEWAFLAVLGIWFGSSLPVYMYFNPSWSHAHSAFTVALFVWYWFRTRSGRSWKQSLLLGVMGGLMVDVYYLNAIVLLILPMESIYRYREERVVEPSASGRTLIDNLLIGAAAFVTFLPTLIEKKIIYGSFFDVGYVERWYWRSPALLKVCFSSNHGLFSWTPILILALAGLVLLSKVDRAFAIYSMAVFSVYVYAVGCYQDWNGLSSFGGRFFVSLTIFFVAGLAAFFEALATAWDQRKALIFASSATAALILWNLGLIFQWGTHLIPARGPISWRAAAHNQIAVVPVVAVSTLRTYLTQRQKLMDQIELQDVHQLKSNTSDGAE